MNENNYQAIGETKTTVMAVMCDYIEAMKVASLKASPVALLATNVHPAYNKLIAKLDMGVVPTYKEVDYFKQQVRVAVETLKMLG